MEVIFCFIFVSWRENFDEQLKWSECDRFRDVVYREDPYKGFFARKSFPTSRFSNSYAFISLH